MKRLDELVAVIFAFGGVALIAIAPWFWSVPLGMLSTGACCVWASAAMFESSDARKKEASQ